MNQKGFANIILVVLIVALVGVVAYFALRKPVTEPTTPPATEQPSVSLPKDKAVNKTAEEILRDKINRSYETCIFVSVHNYGIDGEKLCSEIKYLQENSHRVNYWVNSDSPVKKSNEGGAIAQVDIDLSFFETNDDYNRFVENPTGISLLSKNNAGGTFVQMNSSNAAVDTFNTILSSSSSNEVLTLKGIKVLKYERNGKLDFIFAKDEIVYKFENINPLFETQTLEIIKIVLN